MYNIIQCGLVLQMTHFVLKSINLFTGVTKTMRFKHSTFELHNKNCHLANYMKDLGFIECKGQQLCHTFPPTNSSNLKKKILQHQNWGHKDVPTFCIISICTEIMVKVFSGYKSYAKLFLFPSSFFIAHLCSSRIGSDLCLFFLGFLCTVK